MDVQISAAIISALVAGIIGIMTWLNGRATLKEQRVADRRKSIAKRLNEFYGPLISYLNITESLRRILGKDKPPGFRVLTYLLNPTQEYMVGNTNERVELTESDRIVLAEIVEIEKKIEALILEKSGLAEDPRLMFSYYSAIDLNGQTLNNQDYGTQELTSLTDLITHFRVLSLAFEGKLRGEVDRYERFVFPRGIVAILHENYNRLHRELKDLS